MLKLWNLKEEQLLNENEIDSHKKVNDSYIINDFLIFYFMN